MAARGCCLHAVEMQLDFALPVLLRARRLKWLGHLARMRDRRVAKQLLFADEVPRGARQVGRPQLVWADQARADLAIRREALRGRRWYEVAQNRQAWAAVVGTE